MKHLLILFAFILQTANAQYIVKGTFTDSIKRFKNVVLYQFTNGEPSYKSYVTVKNNGFTFDMSKMPTGYYRALYENTKRGYVDFIYNQENVKLTLNSKIGHQSVDYIASKENNLLVAYTYNLALMQSKLDSAQINYIKNSKKNNVAYQNFRNKIIGAQNYYEKQAQNTYALNFIKAAKRYNEKTPYLNAEHYLNSINTHFFDFVDFDNSVLHNSEFFDNKVNDFVFLLQNSQNINQQNTLYKKAVDHLFSLVRKNSVKESLLNGLMTKFVGRENSILTNYLLEKYQTLPLEHQNPSFLKEINSARKTMLGIKAPDFKINDTHHLYDLTDNNYLIIFWSSTCSHCSAELPKVYNFLEKKDIDIKVITVGLEYEKDEQNWKNQIKFYPDWMHSMAVGKWKSKTARDYNIFETPSYFLLNKDKTIIAKPKSLEVFKKLF